MRKIIFYGDSNTYGFDPRDVFGGCYPSEKIWTFLTAEGLGEDWLVRNEGMNGRCLPAGAGDLWYAARLLKDFSGRDLFAVMLGTNDLLSSLTPDAQAAAERMDGMLSQLTKRLRPEQILVIAPVPVGAKGQGDPALQRYYKESIRMNESFRRLAAQHQVRFADAAGWEIPLAFDGVHFSEEGHACFAEKMIAFLKENGC